MTAETRVSELRFAEVEYGSSEYQMEWDLREAVLRAPLGLSLSDEDTRAESTALHYGLFNGPDCVACLLAMPEPERRYRVKQMAVSPEWQSRGLGARLMGEMETRLAALGAREIALHARLTAEKFYSKLGYVSSGKTFIEVTIPHVRMSKRLHD